MIESAYERADIYLDIPLCQNFQSIRDQLGLLYDEAYALSISSKTIRKHAGPLFRRDKAQRDGGPKL